MSLQDPCRVGLPLSSAAEQAVYRYAAKADMCPAEILSLLQERNGHQTVPQVYIAGRFVGGFDDLVALPRAQLKSTAAAGEKRGCCGGHQCS